MTYEFELPFPPSINGYWRTFRNRQIISKRGREYRSLAISELDRIGLLNESVSGDLTVRMVLNPPTRRKYDIDNFTKAVFDALTHAKFWNDDSQVVSLSIKKGSVMGNKHGGCVTISIK